MLHLFTFNKVVFLFTYPLTHLNMATFPLRIKTVLKVWWGWFKNKQTNKQFSVTWGPNYYLQLVLLGFCFMCLALLKMIF